MANALRTVALVAAALGLLAGAVSAQAEVPGPAPGSFMEAMTQAQQALGGGDLEAARTHLRTALQYAPEYPNVLFHLARVEALLGDSVAALAVLDRLAVQGAARDIGEDAAFAGLVGSARFEAVQAAVRAAAAPVVASDTAWALPDVDFIPEGLAWDAGDDVFYVGSLHRHAIVRVTRDGAVTPFAQESGPGWMVGLRVDAPRRLLWAAALAMDSAAPAFRQARGWASLRAYDLRTGALVHAYAAPDRDRPQLINDVALLPNGDVYVTDSEGGALYRLRSGASALEQVYGDTTDFTYPNGIAPSDAGDRIYIAHVEGLSVLDLTGAAPVMRRVGAARGVATSGIDGLYACGRDLLAVQSLLGFQQVVRLSLDDAGTTVVAAVPVERSHPAHRAATTGAIAGDTFHYVANAQLDRLGEGGVIDSSGGVPSVVLRLPLDGACSPP